jgi:hypothetical protein
MRKLVIACIMLLWWTNCFAETFNIDKCLDTIRLAESSGNDKAVGDHGKARGAYQIQEATWKRYSRLNWKQFAHEPRESREVAKLIVYDIVWQAKEYHAKEWKKCPYRVVCAWYNCGHYVESGKWHNKTKNKVYKGV